MNNKLKFSTIVYAVLVTIFLELILKYFNLDSYIIFAGFRFHLSLVVPFPFILKFDQLKNIKKILRNPIYNKTFQPLKWVFIPLALILISLYIFKKIKIGDPDYFYEFGLSSIIDYPIYFLWNVPQLLMASIFLILIQPLFKSHILFTTLIIILLCITEYLPIGAQKFDFYNVVSLFISAAIISLIIKYFQNIYWLSIIIFSIFWINLLTFGSQSPTLIHILFAANYNSWEGFFEVSKNIFNLLLPIQLAITAILISISAIKKKTII